MRPCRHNEMSLTKGSVAIAVGLMHFATVPWSQEARDPSRLDAIVPAEGDEYLRLRNMLLEQHPRPWDIPTAAGESWECGLAAYILNQRSIEKQAFEMLDNERPSSYRNVNGYGRLTGCPNANMAFLLEKMWKAPSKPQDVRWPVSPEKDRQYAYNTLVQARWSPPLGETALWKSMWRDCDDDQFRFIGLGPLCADPDPSVQPIILEVLHRPDPDAYPYSKYRCMEGLRYRDTEQTVDAILETWDGVMKELGLVEKALAALCLNSSDRARRFVHQFALDENQVESLRSHAVAGFCLRPHPDDAEVLHSFFQGTGSVKMKRDALQWLHKCPLEHIRLPLREILRKSNDPKLISGAINALGSAYIAAKGVDETARAEDVALLEAVRARDTLDGAIRAYAGRCIERVQGNPNPKLPEHAPQGP